MSREQFDAAIGVVPPSTVDVEEVLDRERRRARVRRVVNPWTAAGASVAAVAAGAVLVLAPGGPAPSVVQPGAAPTGAAPPPPSSDACRLAPRPTTAPLREKANVVADRLTTVLTDAVRQRVAAGTTLGVHTLGQYPKGTQHGPLSFFHVFSALVPQDGGVCSGGEDYFMAAASTTEKAHKGNVWAVVTRLGGNASPATECGPAPADTQGSCHRRTGPHGETIVEETFTMASGPTVSRVNVAKPDGTGVIVEAQNTARDANLGDAPDMPSPPLSLGQLAEVALDPGLTLYP
ncbi:hypothetical protein DMA12_25935 [Amycolatopsis balhimycina DSM 5908]|uniref:Uncharacterized protein n=1 Tax=Amycolatopsis balhimycina DSM 5908 TaxID=1081091 RepID=A0A428WCZ9_AMYBA|nr:hypothetical protein [Amycolatopsis balhimycina]RSM40941.1 hypothetical protein DMA12_25935 [Amycolatopsis balhimycina DSM 5908]